jgi:hypothetical protein
VLLADRLRLEPRFDPLALDPLRLERELLDRLRLEPPLLDRLRPPDFSGKIRNPSPCWS